MWGWISVVLFFVSHFCGDWMLHQEKRSCEKGREALQIWVSNTSTLCGKQANHRFQFSIPDPGNVEIPFEIVYISFSVQGSVIGGCTRRTMSGIFFILHKYCRLDPEIRFIELSTQFPWNCVLAFFQREVCLYKFSSMPWILLIYLWDADDD